MKTCILASLGIVLAAGSIARANTFVIDDDGGPGVDFTDIPPAIAAAAAGDVLLVRPGSYSGFTLSKALIVIGYGSPSVTGPIVAQDIVGSDVTALVGLHGAQLDVSRCRGNVIVQELSGLQAMTIRDDADLRLRQFDVDPPVGPRQDAVSAGNTRIEAVSIGMHGSSGIQFPPCSPVTYSQDGGHGFVSADHTRAFLWLCDVRGGDGTNQGCTAIYAGIGGAGIIAESSTRTFLSDSLVFNGSGGFNTAHLDCSFDACQYAPIEGQNLLLRISNTSVGGILICQFGMTCQTFPIPPYPACCPTFPSIPDPRLAVSGAPLPGQMLNYTVFAPSTAFVELLIGRQPATLPVPGFVVEQLVAHPRTLVVGFVPPGAPSIATSIAIPPSAQPGDVFFVQGRVTFPNTGEQRHTNSTPIVVR